MLCRNCGNIVDDTQPVCPHCDFDFSQEQPQSPFSMEKAVKRPFLKKYGLLIAAISVCILSAVLLISAAVANFTSIRNWLILNTFSAEDLLVTTHKLSMVKLAAPAMDAY